MKIMYKDQEISNSTQDYESLMNLPKINSVELKGNMTLADLNMYSKLDIDNLIASSRAVYIVAELPVPQVRNTLYYVGPTSEGLYHVYLCDSKNNLIDLGGSTLPTYRGGQGVNINLRNEINVDAAYPVVINSEGKVSFNIDTVIDENSDDKHVPSAKAVYNSTGIAFDLIYPVGSIFISMNNVKPAKGVWEQLATGRCLWNTTNGKGDLLDGILPDIAGSMDFAISGNASSDSFIRKTFGAFYSGGRVAATGYLPYMSWTSQHDRAEMLSFEAKRGNIMYSSAGEVRPTSIAVTMFKRVA